MSTSNHITHVKEETIVNTLIQ